MKKWPVHVRGSLVRPESKLGLAASVIFLTVLERVGSRDAARLFLVGEKIGPQEAAGMGLITAATADIDQEVEALAKSLVECSPQGLRESKMVLNHRLLTRFDEDRGRVIDQSVRLFGTDEAREGMASFLERRKPWWAVEVGEVAVRSD